MESYLVRAYRLASANSRKFADQLHQLGWAQQAAENTQLYQNYSEALHIEVGINMALHQAQASYLSTLPPLPKGYYLATCADSENGCIGWHVYQHGGWDVPLEGQVPTGEYYCNGGDGEFTQQWLDGTLEPFDSVPE